MSLSPAVGRHDRHLHRTFAGISDATEHHTTTAVIERRPRAIVVLALTAVVAGVGVLALRGGADETTGAPTTTQAPITTTTTEPGPLVGFPRPVAPLAAVVPSFERSVSLVAVDPELERTEWWWFDTDADRTDGLELELLERATIDVSGRWLAGRAIDASTGDHRLIVVDRDGREIELSRQKSISRVVWDNETPGILWWAGRDPALLERVDVTVAVPFRSSLRLGRPLPQGPPQPEATADLDEDWKIVAGNTSSGGATLTVTDRASDAEITVRAPGLGAPTAVILDVVLLPA